MVNEIIRVADHPSPPATKDLVERAYVCESRAETSINRSRVFGASALW